MCISQTLILVICLFLCSYATEAWLARGRFYDAANPGKCSFETLTLSPGETAKSPTECALIHCDDADGNATIEGCIAIEPPPDCEWTDFIDINAPYPECCARNYRCKELTQATKANETQQQQQQMAAAYAENIHNHLIDAIDVNNAIVMKK